MIHLSEDNYCSFHSFFKLEIMFLSLFSLCNLDLFCFFVFFHSVGLYNVLLHIWIIHKETRHFCCTAQNQSVFTTQLQEARAYWFCNLDWRKEGKVFSGPIHLLRVNVLYSCPEFCLVAFMRLLYAPGNSETALSSFSFFKCIVASGHRQSWLTLTSCPL